MKRGLIVVVLVALLWPGLASGQTVIAGSARAPQLQRWVDRSKVPTPDEVIQVVDTRCPSPDAMACTTPGGPIYLDPRISPRSSRRGRFMHEIGHHFDYAAGDTLRAAVAGVMRWSVPWHQPELGFGSPNELFAELYSQCALASSVDPWRSPSGVAGMASNRTESRACALLG